MDTAYLVLFSGLVGAGLTVGAGFLGAWLQHRREHESWLLQRRFDAYLAFQRLIDETLLFRSERQVTGATSARQLLATVTGEDAKAVQLRHIISRAETLQQASVSAFAAVSVLGPSSVKRACGAMLDAVKSDQDGAISEASTAMIAAMAKVVRSTR